MLPLAHEASPTPPSVQQQQHMQQLGTSAFQAQEQTSPTPWVQQQQTQQLGVYAFQAQ